MGNQGTEAIRCAKYAIYEIMKESDIPGSQAIRDSGGTIDMMCATVADKIRAALEENAILMTDALVAQIAEGDCFG